MALDKKKLAQAINEALEIKDKDGNDIETTAEMEVYADAIITSLKTTTVTLLLVEGTAGAPGGPVPDLRASQGTYLPPLTPDKWSAVTIAGFTKSDPAALLTEATTSTLYLTTATNIVFEEGSMQGTSTATPTTPGNLVYTGDTGGKITGLTGEDWAKASLPPTGDPAVASKLYKAIIDYLVKEAEINFAPGTVNGVFASPGAPLTGGVGLGGLIN